MEAPFGRIEGEVSPARGEPKADRRYMVSVFGSISIRSHF